jgi:hypothetical protein
MLAEDYAVAIDKNLNVIFGLDPEGPAGLYG